MSRSSVEAIESRILFDTLPGWVSPTSDATWEDDTNTLTVNGAAEIIGDPSPDHPIIDIDGSGADLTIAASAGPAMRVAELNLTDGGTATVESFGGGGPATNRVIFVEGADGLSVDSSSTLDLEDNALVIDYGASESSPFSDIEDLVVDGFNSGDWLGDGITSSTAANSSEYSVGLADNVELAVPFGDWAAGPRLVGRDVDETAVIVKFTYVGDLTLDGLVEWQDLSVFNTNYDNGATTGRRWSEGDLNYDGYVEFGDLSLFNGSFTKMPPAAPGNLTATRTTATQVDLDWDTVSGSGVTYDVYRSESRYFVLDGTTLLDDGVSSSAYSDTSVQADTRYYYAVVTAQSGYESGISWVRAPDLHSADKDTYVRDGSHASTNYGSSSDLEVKGSTTSGETRRTYLTFDLGDFEFQDAAVLRLYGSADASAPSVTVGVYAVTDDTWAEGTTTWNNKPAIAAAPIDTVTVSGTTDQWYEWDLTPYVTSQLNDADKSITVAIESTASSGPLVTFNSSEAGSHTPKLIGTATTATLPGPAQVTLSATDSEVEVSWTPVSGATSYDVWRRSPDGSFTRVATGVTGTSFIDDSVSANSIYTFWIFASDGTWLSFLPSPAVGVTTSGVGSDAIVKSAAAVWDDLLGVSASPTFPFVGGGTHYFNTSLSISKPNGYTLDQILSEEREFNAVTTINADAHTVSTFGGRLVEGPYGAEIFTRSWSNSLTVEETPHGYEADVAWQKEMYVVKYSSQLPNGSSAVWQNRSVATLTLVFVPEP